MDEFKQRFNAAKADRQHVEPIAREIYKFCFNGREAEWDRTQKQGQEAEEIFTDAPATIAEDFYGELFSTMTPENAAWVEYEAGIPVLDDEADQATQEITEFEQRLSKAVKSSNYYDEGQIAFQDAVVGNVVLWVDRPFLSAPIRCEAVPLAQCYFRLGVHGIADRFRKTQYFTRDLKALFPEATWPKKLDDKIRTAKSGKSTVIWGFWPTYDDPANPIWRQEIRVDDEAIGLDRDLGEEGQVPFLVGRFNPVAGSPWGRGPGWRMLPAIRTLNGVSEMVLEGMDRNLDPAFTYPHDGILDLEDGIETGLGYPAMPGSADSIQSIGQVENLDYGFYSQDQLIAEIEKGFYREVEQRGKTPPSATQFLGHEQKQLRRIARPSGKLWRELGVGLLKRVEFLERQPGGSLEEWGFPVLDTGALTARPISPLERAQAREKVLVAQTILDMAVQAVGQDQAMLMVDGETTMGNIKSELKDELVEFRSRDQIMEMARAMQPQVGGPGEPQSEA